ncbi:MAG: zf-HC2 domain-containing protein [Acidobacteriota bacterium]|nr:zf-HC2 domain-containing protein [Acidobacteriota bacterium]
MFAKQDRPGACSALEARLEDYLGGRLDSRESAEVEVHTRSCPRCAAALETARASAPLLAVLSARPVPAPNPFFVTRVMAAIRGEQRESEVWKPVERAAWRLCWIAAAVVLILTGFMLRVETAPPVSAQQSQIQALVSVPMPQPGSQDDTYLLVASDDNGR